MYITVYKYIMPSHYLLDAQVRSHRLMPNSNSPRSRNGMNLSGTRWTTDLVEKWLVESCWPMDYTSYNHRRWTQLGFRIDHVITMVNAYDDEPEHREEEKRKSRSQKKAAASQPQTPYKYPYPPQYPWMAQPYMYYTTIPFGLTSSTGSQYVLYSTLPSGCTSST